LFLPLLVLGSAMIGAVAGAIRWPRWQVLIQVVLCLFLLNNVRRQALENWVRPLQGERSVLHIPRDRQYFADMTPWNNRDTYFSTVDMLSKIDCEHYGVDITDFQLEYPLLALLRERKPFSTFIHTGVENSSARYRQPVSGLPCAVICLDCAGDTKRLGLYGDFRKQIMVDRFAVLLRD